jgi:hypothetical protein
MGVSRTLISEDREALPYWLQEAKFYQGEIADSYKVVKRQQDEIKELTLARHREIERTDSAEDREQRLKEAIEFYVPHMWPGMRAHFEELLSTLYPDTLAPTPEVKKCDTPRPIDEWHDDIGNVLWWKFPMEEPPYWGTPIDADWPDYHTHWTPLVIPAAPAPKEGE